MHSTVPMSNTNMTNEDRILDSDPDDHIADDTNKISTPIENQKDEIKTDQQSTASASTPKISIAFKSHNIPFKIIRFRPLKIPPPPSRKSPVLCIAFLVLIAPKFLLVSRCNILRRDSININMTRPKVMIKLL